MRSIVLVAAVLESVAGQASAATKPVRHRHHLVMPAPSSAAPDDLYRRRGYGIGGAAFGLGRGGTAMAGTCADLRFGEPRSCGRGYGVYGNGLGYGF